MSSSPHLHDDRAVGTFCVAAGDAPSRGPNCSKNTDGQDDIPLDSHSLLKTTFDPLPGPSPAARFLGSRTVPPRSECTIARKVQTSQLNQGLALMRNNSGWALQNGRQFISEGLHQTGGGEFTSAA